ncbi:MAG: DUF4386 domain-containing protein [Chloroflexi bacterium]|nr:DUF4386 domain-containing protein [Chloroflexota bacterium]
MDTNRMSAMIIGVLFIVATVSAFGAVLYDPILKNPHYLVKGPTRRNQITLGALFELIAAAAVVGTSVAFFPFLKMGNESIALGYVGFRLFEAVIIVIGLISLLSLLTLRQEFASGAALDTSSLQTVGKSLLAIRAWTSVLGPNFMLGINTLMFSFLLYQTRLVPGPIAVMGLIGATLIFIAALLEMFGVILPISLWKVVLALPVASYEMILAVYLIVKGFN